jgi:hypothetical protein
MAHADADGGILLPRLELRDHATKGGCGIGTRRRRLGTLTRGSRNGSIGLDGCMSTSAHQHGGQQSRDGEGDGESVADPVSHRGGMLDRR